MGKDFFLFYVFGVNITSNTVFFYSIASHTKTCYRKRDLSLFVCVCVCACVQQ